MANLILLKRNTTPNKDPAANDLQVGELAINTADKKIFFKQADNSLHYVKSIYASSLDELADVDTTANGGPANKDGLVWNTTTSRWIHSPVSEPVAVVKLNSQSQIDTTINATTSFRFDHNFGITDLGNGAAKIDSPLAFKTLTVTHEDSSSDVISADRHGDLSITVGSNIQATVDTNEKTVRVAVLDDPVFDTITINQDGSVIFGDGSEQFTKAPRIYTNADAELGLSIDDLVPGDYYYDDTTESIYIMIDTGLGYNQLLDLTVRA